MRFYTHQHPFDCGIDVPARSMYGCIVSHNGEILLHRKMKAAPEAFLQAIAPSRDGLVVAVEGLFTWSWRADLCAEQGIAFVLGQALSMKALHGGKAKNDTSDSPTIAALLRGGMLPPSSYATTPRRNSSWPVWRTNLTKAKPCASWRINSAGRSMLCASVRWPSI